MIPILLNHDMMKPIGYVECVKGNQLVVYLDENMRITKEVFFEIFGNCGVRFDDYDIEEGIMIIKKGTILEFSLNG